jgi:hypothetical protein
VLDHQSIGNQRAGQAALVEGLPVSGTDRLDLAVENAVAPEDVAARVAERGRVE